MHEDQRRPSIIDRRRRFYVFLGTVSAAYLAISVAYALRLPMIMDEFQGAHVVHRLSDEIPYRDFIPYKTVLGYYLQSFFLSLGTGLWEKMVSVKIGMALVTALSLAAVSLALRRWLSERAILLSLAMLAFHSTFLERSAELRVDMLTGLAGLLGLTALLGGNPFLAGLLTGTSFLISQKGAYFVIAGGVAAFFVIRDPAKRRLASHWITFWLGSGIVLALYLATFATVSDLDTVFRATFIAPSRVAFEDLYQIRLQFWLQTLRRNPAFYAWSAAALGLLALSAGHWRNRLLFAYSSVLTILAILHRQPWPYFFVLWLPTLFVMNAAGLDLLRDRLSPRRYRLACALLIVTAVALPLTRLPLVLQRDSTAQRRTIEIANRIMSHEDRYLAGMEMIWTRTQHPPELAWLDAPALAALASAPAAEVGQLVEKLRVSPPRLLILNYRLLNLPESVRQHLVSSYSHRGDCVYVYAPPFEPGGIELGIDGSYRLESRGAMRIGPAWVRPGDQVDLAAGTHYTDAVDPFRLHLIPEEEPEPTGRPCEDLFPYVYYF